MSIEGYTNVAYAHTVPGIYPSSKSYDRFREIKPGLTDKISSDYEDNVDDESEALSLCADLCNSLKRLELKRNSSGERPTFGLRQYRHRLGLGSGGSIRLEWLVERNNKPPIDAFELATECIAEWDKFLKRLQSQVL